MTQAYASPEIVVLGKAAELTGGGSWGPYWDNYNHGKYYTEVAPPMDVDIEFSGL